MERISRTQLEAAVKNLNTAVERANKEHSTLNLETYRLDWAYGGVKLEGERSGNDPLSSGYVTKRALFNLITAYRRGIQLIAE